MKTDILACLCVLVVFSVTTAQNPVLKGRVLEYLTLNPIEGASIRLANTSIEVKSNSQGFFSFKENELPLGEVSVLIEKVGYTNNLLSIELTKSRAINLDPIFLQNDWERLDAEIGVISLSEDELSSDEFEINTLPGVLHANKGVFNQAVAYDFSAAFFRPRGLGSRYSKLLVGGIELNSMENGRPLWNLMGGLNDVQRNREGLSGLLPHKNGFGDLGSSTHFIMRASKFRSGGSVSLARANRSYKNRIMGSYHSGVTPSGWSYSVLASIREGDRGFVEGTSYDAKSLFLSIEKTWSASNSINLIAFYAPNQRGRSTPLTDEVLRLKGNRYNPNWGNQSGRERNSRVSKVSQPVIILSHYSRFNENTKWENHLFLTSGQSSSSRIDNAGVRNPYPHYYQRLPSYFLRDELPSVYDFQLAYWARHELEDNGQLSWKNLYLSNLSSQDSIAKYALMNDISNNSQLNFSSKIYTNKDGPIVWMTNLDVSHYSSEKYAELADLLGAANLLDIDFFYDGKEEGFSQSDTQRPNRLTGKGEAYKYHYQLTASQIQGVIQCQTSFGNSEAFLSAKWSFSKYQREGHFRNGYFQKDNRSFGKSPTLTFFNYALKGGLSHKWDARHATNVHMWFESRPPLLQNSFANARQNNDLVNGLGSELSYGGVLSQFLRIANVDMDFSAYYVALKNLTEIGFFFTQNAIGLENNSAFVQEIVQGINQKHIGVEIGLKWQIQSNLALKSALALGQNIFTNHPTVYLSGDDFDYTLNDGFVEGNDLISRGKRKVFLKNYHVAAGPERALKIGLEYRDPNYWWTGVSVNYFSHSYIDPSALRRSEDFLTDIDGLPITNYDPGIAHDLLKQERLNPFGLVNMVGGKSWRLKKYYLGVFASLSNLLNTKYRSGGFEDSRFPSYQQQLEEQNRPGGPLFGNRYFPGLGTTYFLSLSLRF